MRSWVGIVRTGRAVGAQEAERIVLANRVVPKGQARAAAEALARQTAGFPQAAMRGDRTSAQAQFGMGFEDALAYELACGAGALEEALLGAQAFAGRGG